MIFRRYPSVRCNTQYDIAQSIYILPNQYTCWRNKPCLKKKILAFPCCSSLPVATLTWHILGIYLHTCLCFIYSCAAVSCHVFFCWVWGGRFSCPGATCGSSDWWGPAKLSCNTIQCLVQYKTMQCNAECAIYSMPIRHIARFNALEKRT